MRCFADLVVGPALPLLPLLLLLLGVPPADAHTHGYAPEYVQHEQREQVELQQRDAAWVWFSALSSTALIGAAPVLILLFLPVQSGPKQTRTQKNTLKVLLLPLHISMHSADVVGVARVRGGRLTRRRLPAPAPARVGLP